jgi:tetratricopeptide (TPR) repeat protein
MNVAGRAGSQTSVPITKSETLKARIGLSGPALNRIAGPAPKIPDHEMIRCIGHGSYGEVWLARSAVGTWRAIKVVYRQNFKDARPYEREFAGIQSYEPVSRTNEGLIDVLQIGRNDSEGYFYYVMELADGVDVTSNELAPRVSEAKGGTSRRGSLDDIDCETYVPKTLSRVIQQRGRLSYEECLTLGLTLNLALGHLHRHGLIHRDVKPSNIIFVNGVPKLTDIGLVTDLAGAESFVGTEGFIPPEGPNSSQADLYALGKVLYEASMGKDRHEFPEPLTSLGLNPESKALMELNAVLLRACAPNPRERYQRAEEMNADLALLHNGESVRNKHAIARRLKLMTRIGVVTMAIIVLAVIPYYLALREARRATAEATTRKEVAQFLQDLLKRVEPSLALGQDTTLLKQVLDQTRDRIGKDLKDQPAVEAELASTVGEVYRELGQYKEAEKMLRRALDLRLRSLGQEENLTLAQSLSDLSPALWNQGKFAEAELLQRRALEIRTKLAGPDDLSVAESLQDLGCILSARVKVAEAEMMFRRALEIRKKVPGSDQVEVAQSLAGVAHMLNAQGRWKEAEALFREILDIYRKVFGPRHPLTAGVLNALVEALLPQDKLQEAEDDVREGLAIQKEVLGQAHPLVAASLTRLARVLEDEKKLPEAKTNLLEALSIWGKRLDNQDPGIGETVSALFDILLSQGNQAEAEAIFQQVLTPKALGERPNKSLLFACGNYYARTGQWTKAADVFLKMIQLDPENHQAYQALAALYIQNDEVPAYRRFCQQIRSQFGSVTNDPTIADRMAKSCLMLPAEGDISTEARLANVAVTFDENAARAPWFQFCKGLAEYRLGNYDAAAHWLRKVLEKINAGSTRDVEASMVLAMAEFHLNNAEAAQQALSQGRQLAARRLRTLKSGDIESGWTDWILAHQLMHEAESLLGAQFPDSPEPQASNPR